MKKLIEVPEAYRGLFPLEFENMRIELTEGMYLTKEVLKWKTFNEKTRKSKLQRTIKRIFAELDKVKEKDVELKKEVELKKTKRILK